MLKLLPPGELWFLEIASALRNLLRGIADEFKRIRLRGVDLINESDPRTATEALATGSERPLAARRPSHVDRWNDQCRAPRSDHSEVHRARRGERRVLRAALRRVLATRCSRSTRYQSDMTCTRSSVSGCELRVPCRTSVFDDAPTRSRLTLDTPTAGALTEAQLEGRRSARALTRIFEVVFDLHLRSNPMHRTDGRRITLQTCSTIGDPDHPSLRRSTSHWFNAVQEEISRTAILDAGITLVQGRRTPSFSRQGGHSLCV
jgi:hypothetical protein